MLYEYNSGDAQDFKNSIKHCSDLSEKKGKLMGYESECSSFAGEASQIISSASQKISLLSQSISKARSELELEKKRKERVEKELRGVDSILDELEKKEIELKKQLDEASKYLKKIAEYASQTEKDGLENLILKIEGELGKLKLSITSKCNERERLVNSLRDFENKIQNLNAEIVLGEAKKEEAEAVMSQASVISDKCASVQGDINYAGRQLEDIEHSLDLRLSEIESNVSAAMDSAEEVYYVDITGKQGHGIFKNFFGRFGNARFRIEDEELEKYQRVLKDYKEFFKEREEALRKLFESFSWRDNIYRVASEDVAKNKEIVFSVVSDMQESVEGIERLLNALSEYKKWA